MKQKEYGLIRENLDEKKKQKEEQIRMQNEFKLKKINIKSMIPQFIKQSFIEAKRRVFLYILAFMAIFLVVTTSCVSQSLISSMPIIFKSQAESSQGQQDIVVYPNKDTDLLNLTAIKQVLKNDPEVNYLSNQVVGRISVLASLATQQSCGPNNYNQIQQYLDNPLIMQTVLSNINSNINCYYQTQVNIRIIDTLYEKALGLGQWPFSSNIAKGNCLMSSSLANSLSLKKGQIIYLNFRMDKQISQLGNSIQLITNIQYYSLDQLQFLVPLIIQDTFNNIGMKYAEGSETTSSVFVETEWFLDHTSAFLFNSSQLNQTNQNFTAFIQNSKLSEYSDLVLFNYPNRNQVYIQSNYDDIQQALIQFGNSITNALGFYAIVMELPILESLSSLKFVSMFFGLIINMIIFILLLLSIILIYSLLLVTVETKSFDLGIFRILGLNKIGIVIMIFIQCMSYVIPSLISGLLISIPILQYISNYIEKKVSASIPSNPSDSAIIFSCMVGIIIPLFSCIVPVQIALKQELSEALDSTRNKTKAVRIEIKSNAYSVSENRVFFSIISAFFGISIYYLLPLALLSLNIGLLLGIFFWILIGMLVGAVLLTINIQYLFEKMIVQIFFICYKSATKSIIIKNLAAHRLRNRRTGLMYSISLAFIIFLLVSYQLSIGQSVQGRQMRQGADLVLNVPSSSNTYIQLQDYDNFIRTQLIKEVNDYAYMTRELTDYMQSTKQFQYYTAQITHQGRLYNYVPQIFAVSPNYLQITYSTFLTIQNQNSFQDSQLDLVQQLYTARGSQSAIIADIYYSNLNLNTVQDNNFFIRINALSKTSPVNQAYFQYKTLASVSSFTGFSFSKSPSKTNQPIIMSIPSYIQLANSNYQTIKSYSSVPIKKILFKLTDNSYKSVVKQNLQSFMSKRGENFQIQDITDFQNSLTQQETIVNVLFSSITYIVMFLCYFSLVSAMTANIYEQTKEIAVYRALGLTKSQMSSIYMYEAFVLVFSSSFMGLIIGTLLGFIMTLQNALFTDLPIRFIFPYLNFIVILIASILVSYLSTRQTSHHIMNKQISEISRINF